MKEPGQLKARADLRRSTEGTALTEAATRWRPWVPRFVAWVVRIAALVTLFGVLLPEVREQLHEGAHDARIIAGISYAAAVVVAGVQIVVASGLAHRKRRAWYLTVAVCVIALFAHDKGGSTLAFVINLALLALLAWTRRDFTARSEGRQRWLPLRVFLVLYVTAFGAGMIAVHHVARTATLWQVTQETFDGLLGFAPDLPFDSEDLGNTTRLLLGVLGVLVLLFTVLALLAPARKRSHTDPADQQRLRELLERHGERDSLGYFALREDKAVMFSPTGKAAIAYRVIGSVTLASGDPIGDPEAWPGAITAWLAEGEEYAWVPGVLGASEEGATAYVRAGMDALEIGDEAVLDLEVFSLEGRPMRGVRQAVNRVCRSGYTVSVARQRELAPEQLAEVKRAADAFRDGDVERGFSMALGRLGDAEDPELMIAVCRDAAGAVVAVLGFVPWGRTGLSLDLMRRSRDSENGTVEFVVTEVAAQVKALGITRLSLNFAVFRSAFEEGARVGAGPVLRLWRHILLLASRWWQIESLYRANAKYNPQWEPRYIAFRKAADLPRIGIAALEAEAFIARPRLRFLGGGS